MLLKGKVAFITGAGRGFGRAVAIAMSREGAEMALCSRTASELEKTADSMKREGREALVLPLDVSDESALRNAVDRAVSELGGIDILVNNAAVVGPAAPLHEVNPDDWDRTLVVNLTAPMFLSQEVIPHMIDRGGGRIINVTSGMAQIVMPLFGAYSISKAALDHMTRVMAHELGGFNVQVNGLDPGVMDTRMQEEIRSMGPETLGKALHSQFQSFKETGSLRPPEEIANLAVFLASDLSEGITGEIGGAAEYRDYGYGLEQE